MRIKQIMPCYYEAIIAIFGYICVMAIVLVVIFKPWDIQKVTTQTRASSTTLIDDNSIITPEHNLPYLELPVDEEDDIGTAKRIAELTEEVAALRAHIDSQYPHVQSAAEVEVKPAAKKKKWFRFSSKN